MKPTEKQKKVIDLCIQHLKYWKDTDDLYSPTHMGDLQDDFEEIADGEMIIMAGLLRSIRMLK